MLHVSCSMVCIGCFGSGCVLVPFPKLAALLQQESAFSSEQLQELIGQAGGVITESPVIIHSQRSLLVIPLVFSFGQSYLENRWAAMVG